MQEEEVKFKITPMMGEMEKEMKRLQNIAENFSKALTKGLKSAAFEGKALGDVLRGLMLNLSETALNAALKPLEDSFSSFLGSILKMPLQKGMSFMAPSSAPTPFAKGGVLGAPTYFPMRGGSLGVAGEAGPEAILPLARGSDGRLGVKAEGRAPVAVTVNISTPDIESFHRSEARLSALLARAVARGRRAL